MLRRRGGGRRTFFRPPGAVMPLAKEGSRTRVREVGHLVQGRLVAVGVSQLVGVAFGHEAGVPAAVVADGHGTPSEVHDLYPVGLAWLFAFVVVIASMDRVDGAGGHLVVGLHVCRVEHGGWPFWDRVGLTVEPSLWVDLYFRSSQNPKAR